MAVAASSRQKASLLRCLRCIDMIWFVGESISRVGVRASLPRYIELRVLKSDVWSGMTSKCWRFCRTKRHTAQLTDQSQYRDRSISECAAFPLARAGFRWCRGRCLRFSGDFPAGTGGRCRRLRSATDRSVPNVASCCRKSPPTMMVMMRHADGLVRSPLPSPHTSACQCISASLTLCRCFVTMLFILTVILRLYIIIYLYHTVDSMKIVACTREMHRAY